MRIGIKIWSTNTELFPIAEELYKQEMFSYLEVYMVPGTIKNCVILKKMGIPLVLHAPHSRHGFNAADRNNKKNSEIYDEIEQFALLLKPEFVIFHPEFGEIEQSIRFLKTKGIKNSLIENMPKSGLNGEDCIGATPEEISLFLKAGFGFCLDFSHAIKAGHTLKKDFIPQFLSLGPKMFHISDGHRDSDKDEHLNLGEGDFDIKSIKKRIEALNNAMLTFETPKTTGLDNDIKNINYFLKSK